MYRASVLLAPVEQQRTHRPKRVLWRWIAVVTVVALAATALRYASRDSRTAGRDPLPWPATGEASLLVNGHRVDGPGATLTVPIASVAKVMTAYVVLHDHPLPDGQEGPTLTVSGPEAAAYPGQLAAGESLVRVISGEQLTERQALEALLLPSADNMAWILARWDAGSQPAFVARMKSHAARLGMHHTTYTDASGLAASTVSSAVDQIALGRAALKIPALAAIVAERSATLPVAGVVRNYNTLLGSDGVIGLKTGSTSAAGGCLLFAARSVVNGHQVTVVGAVLGQPGKGRRMLTAALRASHELVLAAQRPPR